MVAGASEFRHHLLQPLCYGRWESQIVVSWLPSCPFLLVFLITTAVVSQCWCWLLCVYFQGVSGTSVYIPPVFIDVRI